MQRIVEAYLTERFSSDFGVAVNAVDISAIEVDKTCPEYAQLLRITRDVATNRIEARADSVAELRGLFPPAIT